MTGKLTVLPATWLTFPPELDPANPLLLDKAPRKGNRHWIRVQFPFAATPAEPFWCLYQPPMSYYNGWGYQPQEIPDSSVELLVAPENLPILEWLETNQSKSP
jgi:hypothetical protein